MLWWLKPIASVQKVDVTNMLWISSLDNLNISGSFEVNGMVHLNAKSSLRMGWI